MTDRMTSGPHKGRVPAGIDVCETCMGFIAYGTIGDWSAKPERNSADNKHAQLMSRRLGVSLNHVALGGTTSNEDGSFSHSGCEACGATSCTVYPATMYYRPMRRQQK
jgi:hypothetical protein